ncbi:MAG: hypothetical protein ACREIM_03340, partial [Nitrospiraceae bacterium]
CNGSGTRRCAGVRMGLCDVSLRSKRPRAGYGDAESIDNLLLGDLRPLHGSAPFVGDAEAVILLLFSPVVVFGRPSDSRAERHQQFEQRSVIVQRYVLLPVGVRDVEISLGPRAGGHD